MAAAAGGQHQIRGNLQGVILRTMVAYSAIKTSSTRHPGPAGLRPGPPLPLIASPACCSGSASAKRSFKAICAIQNGLEGGCEREPRR